MLIRGGLFAAFAASLTAIGAALILAGPGSTEAWATVAAGLAVITSVLSAWSAQRVLELTEDEQQAYPYPSIDVMSRYGLMQLRVRNSGGSAAHDVRIHWTNPLLHPNGSVVRFTKAEGAPDIPVLLPKESVSVLVGGSHEMYLKYREMNYSGELQFVDVSGTQKVIPFHVSAESYRSSLTYTEEDPRTHYELQRIPKEIEKLSREVRLLRDQLQQPAGDE